MQKNGSGGMMISARKVFLILLCLGVLPLVQAQETAGWQQYVDPAEAGFNKSEIDAARQFAEEIGSSGVMLVYKGRVVVAWGDVRRPFKCHSVRKSLLSALYGPFVAKGLVELETTMGELEITDLQPLTASEQQATIYDLLTARSGIYLPAAKETTGHKRGRPEREAHKPGEHWWYNNWDFNVAGVVFEMQTRQGLFHAFKRTIADPIGMQDFGVRHGHYQYEPGISKHPAYEVRMSTRDRARFGQLMLQRGQWQGREIIPAAWVDRSTRPISRYAEGRGYGMMWWTYSFPEDHRLAGLNCYAASGSGGQLILVVPEEEMVFVHSANTDFSRNVGGGDVWELFGRLRDARSGAAIESPRLEKLNPQPFESMAPPLPVYERVWLTPAYLERFTGEYLLSSGFVAEISVWHDQLLVHIDEIGEALMVPMSETAFFRPDDNITGEFLLDESGEPVAIDLNINGQKMTAERKR
jgi:CubicO group peptidase (beta-lactamase class C family)